VGDERAPVLIGVAQRSVRPGDAPAGDLPLEGASDPLALLEAVARAALADAGLGRGALASLDTIGLVDALGWAPRNGPRLLAERLGAAPRRELATGVGGEVPLILLDHVARAVLRGEVELALLAGVHVIRSFRLARSRGVHLDLPLGGAGEPTVLTAGKPGHSPREAQYGLVLPSTMYPLFENALRARRGEDLEAHRRRLGALMAPFTRVAAANPHAWFPLARSAEELVRVGPENRMVAFPYPKYLNAVIETDQAAAVLVASNAAAERLGVPEARRVGWWGGGAALEEPWFATERPDLAASPALGRAARAALAEAGVRQGELAHLDLYSCFPVAVELACEALGLAEDDPRGFTVTGGLPYAGGPGNAYCLHALAATVERVRASGGSALVTGNGWYLTKHSAAVLGPRPREGAPAPLPAAPPAPAAPAVAFADEASGAATLETYTVVYGRAGEPAQGIAVGRQDDGRRFLADLPPDPALLAAFAAREGVGREGRVAHRDGRNRFEPR
jgi:acetyl-CoA C-acetyltransferase